MVITLPWDRERALPLVMSVLLVSVHSPRPSWEAMGSPRGMELLEVTQSGHH